MPPYFTPRGASLTLTFVDISSPMITEDFRDSTNAESTLPCGDFGPIPQCGTKIKGFTFYMLPNIFFLSSKEKPAAKIAAGKNNSIDNDAHFFTYSFKCFRDDCSSSLSTFVQNFSSKVVLFSDFSTFFLER